MEKRIILYAFLICALFCNTANAQTFAPGSAPLQKTENAAAMEKEQINVDNPLKLSDSSEQENETLTSSEGGMFIPAQNKIGSSGRDDEKIYDNSLGSVFEFHFEEGEVVFDSNDDNRKILIYYDNYKIEKGLDNLVRCYFRLYVLNDLTEKLNNISFKLKWPEISTNIQMVQVQPGVRTYVDTMLLGEGCYSMDKVPVIEVNRCRVKGKTEDQCADAVRWFNKNQ